MILSSSQEILQGTGEEMNFDLFVLIFNKPIMRIIVISSFLLGK